MNALGLRHAPHWFLRLVFLFALALPVGMLLVSLRAHAQDLDKPMLLVANPKMQGLYRGAVILATPVAGTHVGFILNRPTSFKMGRLFPGHAPSAAITDPVYFGGPETSEAIFAMVRGESPDPSALELTPGVWIVSKANMVDAIIESKGNEARYFAGFVGWRPRELAAELEKGYFTPRPVDPAKLFLPDTSTLYEDLKPKKGMVGT